MTNDYFPPTLFPDPYSPHPPTGDLSTEFMRSVYGRSHDIAAYLRTFPERFVEVTGSTAPLQEFANIDRVDREVGRGMRTALDVDEC